MCGGGRPPETPAGPGPDAVPVIGTHSAPPPALVVAVSSRLADGVRSARRRQFVTHAFGILGTLCGAAALAAAVHALAGAGRAAVLAETGACGVLLVLGAVMRRRPLELGWGLVARDASGRVRVFDSLRGWMVLVASAFREAAEGFVYGTGLGRSDPAAELAAWVILALSPPHGPPQGTWVSLEGVCAAGLFSLPEDMKPATRALVSRGWVELDRSVYPPRVRLTRSGGEFVEGLAGGRQVLAGG